MFPLLLTVSLRSLERGDIYHPWLCFTSSSVVSHLLVLVTFQRMLYVVEGGEVAVVFCCFFCDLCSLMTV